MQKGARGCAIALALVTGGLALACSGSPGADETKKPRSGFFVSASDTLKGEGTLRRPWSLAKALSHPAAIKPGDTIWLAAGRYRGEFTSRLQGTREMPVVLRALPGARATIDGLLIVRGDNAVYRDFEVTNSNPVRSTSTPGSDPADYKRRAGIDVHGSDTKFINLVVHDAGGGFGVWSQAIGVEVYGCLVYYNGWQGPERGHGHGIYGQNQLGTKRLVDNVIFAQFGNGINIYGSDQAFLSGFELDGNIAFDNGVLSQEGFAIDMFVGGATPARRIVARNNATYRSDGLLTARFGYDPAVLNEDLRLTDNYFVGQTGLSNWSTVIARGNSFTGAQNLLEIQMPDSARVSLYDWEGSRFIPDLRRKALNSNMPIVVVENDSGRGYDFAEWARTTGNDRLGTTAAKPSGTHVIVRPNRYETGRAHIAVYNWDAARSVNVDLAGVLAKGDRYELRSVYDFYGDPVARGKYDGRSIRIRMELIKPVAPVGRRAPDISGRAGEFGAFVVIRTD